jgi:3-methyladenine DNA glycosylase AlkD
MPAIADLVAPFETTLRALADPVRAEPMRAYMQNQFAFLGLPAPVRRNALKAMPKMALPAPELLALAEALWRLPEREFRYTAVDLLARQHRCLDLKALPHLLQLVQRDAWWDTVDALAGVIGDVLLRAKAGQADVQQLADAWLLEPNLWLRRVAMLHQLGWRGQTDVPRLFRYALALGHEKEFFVRKAIGWALRDYAKTAPAAVQAFLERHRDRFSGLTLREAGKHLNTARDKAL